MIMSANCDVPNDYYLKDLAEQLHHLMSSRPSERPQTFEEETEDPMRAPIFWISTWIDTERYGLGYKFCDNSVGVLFNDITSILIFPDKTNVRYIDRNAAELYHTTDNYPIELCKKMTLLNYFENYMNEQLVKTGEKPKLRYGDDLLRLPYLSNWFRTHNAIVFQLTNGTIQINFIQDHTKLILCPLMQAFTYINNKRDFKTYKFNLIERYGCSKEISDRLGYARDVVDRLQHRKLQSNTQCSNDNVNTYKLNANP